MSYDLQTREYFNQLTPSYNPERFRFAAQYINSISTPEQSLIDIGCGDGATLFFIKNNTQLTNLFGLDISNKYLEKVGKLIGCQTIEGSILNQEIVNDFSDKFDFCVLGAVLHHLVGKTRKESFSYTYKCLENSLKILKPEGSLLIFEPTHSPSWMMDIVFLIKRTFGRFSNSRIEIFSKWANFGQPVVSYYTPQQLYSFLEQIPEAKILEKIVIDNRKMAFLIERVGLGVIVKRL